MKETVANRIYVLFTLSIILAAFAYQCHPTRPVNQVTEKIGAAPLVALSDIKEGSLVMKVSDSDRYELLPQLQTNVAINIEGMVSSTTIDQVFTNSSEQPVEALYVFPLPHTAAVHDMKMLVNDRLIEGVIKEKEEARETYERAKAEGKLAGLAGQERPNIFTSSVANIMPGDTVIVRLTYVETLRYENGTFSLRFPMVVAPRYIPGEAVTGYSGYGRVYDTDAVPDASRITPPVVPPGTRSGAMLSLRVNVNAGLPISSMRSISHDITAIRVEEGAYRIQLRKKETIPNKDFVLEYRIEQGSEPKASLFIAKKDGDDYFMLMAVPPVNAEEDRTLKKEIVFVLDISGSMAGTSLVQAKEGLINALNLLSADDSFDIISFHDNHDIFAPSSVEASAVNVMNGINYVNTLEAQGGTEALPALKQALMLPRQPDALRMIIFLTDGAVGNEDQLASEVNQHVGDGRLFTVGIGSAPNGHLLEQVSRSGRGTFTYISNRTDVQEKIRELFAKIENPVLMDLGLDIAQDAEIFPDPIPDLFAGQPLILFGKTEGVRSLNARLTGRSADGHFTIDIPMDLQSATREPAIPTLWARSKVTALMDEYRQGNEAVKEQIVDLALRHSLITQFTSFIAVEHRVVNPGGTAKLSAIPTELPEGWVYEKVMGEENRDTGPVRLAYLPQTASDAPRTAGAGFILIVFGSFMLLVRFRHASKQGVKTRQQ